MLELVIIGAESQYVRNELHRQRREAQVVDRCLSKRRLGGHIARTTHPSEQREARARDSPTRRIDDASIMKFRSSLGTAKTAQKTPCGEL